MMTSNVRAFGLNISPLHSSGAPASEFDNADGTFNTAGMYRNFDVADQLGTTWLRVLAPWAADTAALATPLIDRLNVFGHYATGRGQTVIVDNGVPPLYAPALLMPDANGNAQAYSTQTEAELETLCHDAMVAGPQYNGISNVRYWGLWNEGNLEVRLATGNSPLFGAGLQASDFDTPIAHRAAACVRGQVRAIHENGQLAVLNFTDVNIGWPLFLASQGVTWDVIGWHVYADSLYDIRAHVGQPAAVSAPQFGIEAGQQLYDIPRMLAGFNTPVIFEELNAQERYQQTSTDPDDALTLKGDMSLVNMLTQTGRASELDVLATIIYRSFDQDDHPYARERHFGLLRNPSSPTFKGAARALLPFSKPGTIVGVQ